MKFLAFFLLYVIDSVWSHSWIACSDYTEKNGEYWDSNKCRGFPRDAQNFAPKESFGLDRGFDHRPQDSTKACKTTYSANSYSAAYPKAVYYPGQQVILAHPMKNHGADTCTNQYIPDFGNFIYRGKKNGDTDQVLGYYRRFKVADLGVSKFGYAAGSSYQNYPKPGYQNAPKFCEDTDKSMGTYSFNVPNNLEDGEYTFVWRWSFNGPGDMYSTCFDVIIARNKAERDNILRSRGAPLDVACGGVLSNNQRGSTIGCDGSVAPPPPLPPKRPTTKAPRTTRRPRPPAITRPPRPIRPTRPPTTTAAPEEQRAVVNAFQITGEITLDAPRNGIKRRYLSVEFDCPVRANFWNARVLGVEDKTNYELLQESSEFLGSQKVFFTASFDEPCDMAAYPPLAFIDFED